MKVFIAALDEGGLRKAGRKLGRSPAAISRALAFLEAHVGVTLLHRTTRSFKLSEAGERYAIVCRRVIADLEEADLVAAGERSAPRGTLTITAPVAAGENVLRSVLDAFMDAYPTVSVKLLLLDRPVSLIDEGIDIALRIAHLTDSTHVAIRLGEVRLVVAASPRYLSTHPKIEEPIDLAKHKIIAMTHFGTGSWTFPPVKGSSIPRSVQFSPRFVVNSVRGAIASAVATLGGHPETHILGDTFYSQAPLRFDDFIAKISVAPKSPELRALTRSPLNVNGVPNGLREAVLDFFKKNGGVWEVRAQLCTDLEHMPIENAAVVWSEEVSPYQRIARITVKPQLAWSEVRSSVVDDGMSFTPWHGLAAHRPLGGIMRVRKAAYEAAKKFRAERNGRVIQEPREMVPFED